MKKFLVLLLVVSMALCLGCSTIFDYVTAYADKDPATRKEGVEGTADPLSGSGAKANAGSSSAGTLTIYTCMPDTEWPYFINAFIADTGIEVNCISMSEEALLNRILTEKGSPGASVMLGGDTSLYEAAAAAGVLSAYASRSLSDIPNAYIHTGNYWTPIYVDAVAFVFNEGYFSSKGWRKPSLWSDLTNGSYNKGIILAHPAYDDICYEFLAILNQQMGPTDCRHYMRNLSSTVLYYTRTTASALSAVAAGQAGITLAYAQDALYYTTAAGGNINLSVYFPSEGSICKVSAAALIAGGIAGEEANAQRFIDWISAKEGQDVIRDTGTFHIPVNRRADIDPAIISIDDLVLADYSAKKAAEERDSLTKDFLSRVDDASTMKN